MVLRGKTTCLDVRYYGRKRRKPAWRGLPRVSPRRAYQGLFLVFGGVGGGALEDRAGLNKSIKTIAYATQLAQGTSLKQGAMDLPIDQTID